MVLASRFRAVRLRRKWKQSTLAERSGVALPSLRRFEQTGQISLKSLLQLAFVLGRLGDFDAVFEQPQAESIAELEALSSARRPKRGNQ